MPTMTICSLVVFCNIVLINSIKKEYNIPELCNNTIKFYHVISLLDAISIFNLSENNGLLS